MVVAIVQLSTSFESTVMSSPSWFAMASSGLGVAHSMVQAVSWTSLLFAAVSHEAWGTHAGSVVAAAVGLIAAITTALDRAIESREPFIARAHLAPLITNSVATAVIGAQFGLDCALQTKQSNRAQAVPFMALASVILTTHLASLLGAGVAFPSSLAQAGCVIPTVTIGTIWANWLRAIKSSESNITLALSSHPVAMSMSRAPVGANLLLTSLSHEAGSTVAHSVNTSSVGRAVGRAPLERAVKPSPAELADTVGSDTVTMTGTVIGAWASRAVKASVAGLTVASSVVADSRVGAVVQASSKRAICAHPSFVTSTGEVLAATMSRAVIGTNDSLGAISPTPALNALASSIVADTVAGAVSNTGTLAAIISLPSGGTVTGSIAAVTMSSAVTGASQKTAVETGEARVALAGEVGALAIEVAMVGAHTAGAILASVSRVTLASTILTESVV